MRTLRTSCARPRDRPRLSVAVCCVHMWLTGVFPLGATCARSCVAGAHAVAHSSPQTTRGSTPASPPSSRRPTCWGTAGRPWGGSWCIPTPAPRWTTGGRAARGCRLATSPPSPWKCAGGSIGPMAPRPLMRAARGCRPARAAHQHELAGAQRLLAACCSSTRGLALAPPGHCLRAGRFCTATRSTYRSATRAASSSPPREACAPRPMAVGRTRRMGPCMGPRGEALWAWAPARRRHRAVGCYPGDGPAG
jgi:hypothetical protein